MVVTGFLWPGNTQKINQLGKEAASLQTGMNGKAESRNSETGSFGRVNITDKIEKCRV